MTVPGYVISNIRTVARGQVIVEIVTDRLQRMAISFPAKRTSASEIAETIDWTLSNLDRRPVPVQ